MNLVFFGGKIWVFSLLDVLDESRGILVEVGKKEVALEVRVREKPSIS